MSKFIFFAVVFISISANAERYRVLCESFNFQYRECLVPGQVQDVFLVQERSGRQCIPNHAYGILPNGVWVNRGCQAVFEVVTYGGRQVYDMNCFSNGRYQFCPVGGYLLNAFVLREYGRAACIQGRNWGIQRDGIWVDFGCQAMFRVTVDR